MASFSGWQDDEKWSVKQKQLDRSDSQLFYYSKKDKGGRHKCYREHTAVRKHQ